ncbi:nuclear transport factor 2 family protein, partial [Paraburkholderia sp. SIMBA_050]
MSNNIKTVPTHDYDAAIAVAQKYVDGLRAGSAEHVAEAFHKDACVFHTKLDSDFAPSWTGISREGGHG